MRFKISSLIIFSMLLAGCVNSIEKITPPGNFNPTEDKQTKYEKTYDHQRDARN